MRDVCGMRCEIQLHAFHLQAESCGNKSTKESFQSNPRSSGEPGLRLADMSLYGDLLPSDPMSRLQSLSMNIDSEEWGLSIGEITGKSFTDVDTTLCITCGEDFTMSSCLVLLFNTAVTTVVGSITLWYRWSLLKVSLLDSKHSAVVPTTVGI